MRATQVGNATQCGVQHTMVWLHPERGLVIHDVVLSVPHSRVAAFIRRAE